MKRNHREREVKTCSAASTVATPPWASSSASISSMISGSRVEVVRIDLRASIGDSPGEREREMSRLRLRRPSGWRKSRGVSTVEGVEESRRRRRTYGGLREAGIAAATGDGHRGPSRRQRRAIRCRERGQSSGGTLWERGQLCRAWPELFRRGRRARRCHIISNLIRYRPTPASLRCRSAHTPARSSLCLSATLVRAHSLLARYS